jgi:hypothetical protein
MSSSLKTTYEVASVCLGRGWCEEAVKGYIEKMSRQLSQGEFIPSYNGTNSSYEPRIVYHFNGKIKLNKGNIKKISDIAMQLGLYLDAKKKTAKISEKRRVRKREIIRITEKPEKITVTSPKTIINSPVYNGKLLEGIGEVFGIEA